MRFSISGLYYVRVTFRETSEEHCDSTKNIDDFGKNMCEHNVKLTKKSLIELYEHLSPLVYYEQKETEVWGCQE